MLFYSLGKFHQLFLQLLASLQLPSWMLYMFFLTNIQIISSKLITYPCPFFICLAIEKSIWIEDHRGTPVRHQDNVPKCRHFWFFDTFSRALNVQGHDKNNCLRKDKTGDLQKFKMVKLVMNHLQAASWLELTFQTEHHRDGSSEQGNRSSWNIARRLRSWPSQSTKDPVLLH